MDLDINWKSLAIAAVVVVGTLILTRLVRWLINESFIYGSDRLNVDSTRYRFFKNAASFIIWLIALGTLILLIPELKALAITLFAGAGILVAIAGLAAQQAFSNIVSGIFIVIFKPFRVGDMIKVGNLNYGIVEDITLRHTIINNFENKRIIIPNSVISSETIINDSIEDRRVCRWIEVGISYDSDIDRAIEIIQEESVKHRACIDVRTDEDRQNGVPQVNVRVLGFGDSSINLRAFVWSSESLLSVKMHSDINRAIKKRFDAEGIEIPFPYRTIVYKKDLHPNR